MKTTIITVLTAVVLAGCGSGAAAQPRAAESSGGTPVTLTNCGLPLTVPAPPRRAITLEQNATEIVLSLGLGDRLIGASYQTDPPLPELRAAYEKVPVLAKLYPSKEAVRAAGPDFVYSTYTSAYGPDAAGSRQELGALGVPAYLSPFACEKKTDGLSKVTFDGLFAEVKDIARVFGVPANGDRVVAELQARLDAATKQKFDADTSLLWYYSGTSTPYVAGAGGLPAAVSALLGVRNTFGDVQETWPAGNWEEIARRNPDVIVVADLTRGGDGDSAAAKIAFLRSNPVTSKLDAVVRNRIITVPGSSMDPSIRNVTAVEQVSAGLRAFAG